MTKLQLKQLQAKWTKRLKDEGFVDIEDEYGNLKEFHGSVFYRKGQTSDIRSTTRYFQVAGSLLFSFPFTSRQSRAIWRLHCYGHSNARIADTLGISEEAVAKSVTYVASHIKEI